VINRSRWDPGPIVASSLRDRSVGVADDIFEHPRLAAIYDALDSDRSDLDVYVAIADELGARRVLDVGCGTGTLARVTGRPRFGR
jgi:2-polyprenyl-3-methyl-5-hydroxy-6-metoxy-1,4-benzoquinol methylase